MQRGVSTGEAAEAPGVPVVTLRRREGSGKLSGERTPGGHRRYDLPKLRLELFQATPEDESRTIACARVPSRDRNADLECRKQVLELYCARRGWTFEVVSDLGSSMDDHKKRRKKLLDPTVFPARLHGSRSRRNRRLPEGVTRAAQEAGPC